MSAGRWVAAGVALCVLALVGFAGVQYLAPDGFDNPAGANVEGARLFEHELWGASFPRLSTQAFSWTLRLLLATAWIGYALAVIGALRRSAPSGRWVLPLVAAMSLGYAIFCPPLLSRDVYAYVAFARMGVLHGWNPYLHTVRSLSDAGDAAASLYPAEVSCTYGPLWTLVSYAVVAGLREAGVWWQVVGHKVVTGLATVAAAVAGREIARAHSPGRDELTVLAIGLNPLLLIEGPGNGHNDLPMVALMLVGIALHARKRALAGYVLVGLSAGIKFVSLAIAPWLVLEEIRGRRPGQALSHALLASLLVLAPTAMAFAPFWAGSGTLHGIRRVYEVQTTSPAEDNPATGVQWVAKLVGKEWPLELLYLGLSIWLWRGRTPGRSLAAWALLSAALPFLAMPTVFPWYLIWPWSTSLVRWDRLHTAISLGCLVVSIVLLSLYAA